MAASLDRRSSSSEVRRQSLDSTEGVETRSADLTADIDADWAEADRLDVELGAFDAGLELLGEEVRSSSM